MFRWLKDRKKQKKNPRQGDVNDDYGFQAHARDSDDKVYHIYEEIPDLPTCVTKHSESSSNLRETSFSDPNSSFDQSTASIFSAETLRKYIIGSQDKGTENPPRKDGPYMVVPLLNSTEEEKPPLPPPNEKKTEFTCALVGRRNSSLSRSTESGVEVSYDSSESLEEDSHCRDNVDVHVKELLGERLQAASRVRTHAREASLDTSDTGYEYDMSTSSESDQANYEYYLNKIEENLIHKCKIREIIQQCVPEEDESDRESLTTVSSLSCCSSTRTCKLVGGHRSTDIESDEGTLADHSESENSSGYYETFNGPRDKLSPRCAFSSSGKGPLKQDSKPFPGEHSHDCQRQHYIKNKKRTLPKKCKHRSVDALGLCIPSVSSENSRKHRSIDALGLCSSQKGAFKKINRPNQFSGPKLQSQNSGVSRVQGISQSPVKLDIYEPLNDSSLYDMDYGSPRSVCSVDSEGREVYSPPPSVTDFSSRNTGLSSRRSLQRPMVSTNVYRSHGSQNRLLSDLIIMNYDRQVFIH
ncbi:uncharacterized protein [Haliotis asinina]|uniref:uncharacterized protein n=1 Tax=Haliotis asinina TaxID=109174 RepID=UPI0035325C9A